MDELPDPTGEHYASGLFREVAAKTDEVAEKLREVAYLMRGVDDGEADLDLLMGITLLSECAYATARGEFDVAEEHALASVRHSRKAGDAPIRIVAPPE